MSDNAMIVWIVGIVAVSVVAMFKAWTERNATTGTELFIGPSGKNRDGSESHSSS